MRTARVLERPKFQAILLKSLDLTCLDTEGFNTLIVLQFQRASRGPVLHYAKHLHDQNWVLDETSISADLLALCLRAAHVALVLDLDKVQVHYESAYFNNVSDDVISLNGFEESQLGACLEIIYLVLYLSNHTQITGVVLQLYVDVEVV